jgi:hypothetical protein
MKYWITKYALTTGILEVSSSEAEECGSGMLRVRRPKDYFDQYMHGEGRDWHKSLESAVSRAETMRKSKIASLQKSIAKMTALSFEVKS